MGNKNVFQEAKRAMEQRSEEGDRRFGALLNPEVVKEVDVKQVPFMNEATLLHWAAYHNRVALIQPLVEMGADINARDAAGQTPFFTACFFGKWNVAVVLAALGVDYNARDCQGRTPIYIACIRGHRDVAVELAALGGDQTIRANDGRSALDVAQLHWGDTGSKDIEEAFDASQIEPR